MVPAARADELTDADPEVVRQCRPELLRSACYEAVFEAVKGLGVRLREKSGLDQDGRALVQAALRGKPPRIPLTDNMTVAERNEQEGVALLAEGIFAAFRNPAAHTPAGMEGHRAGRTRRAGNAVDDPPPPRLCAYQREDVAGPGSPNTGGGLSAAAGKSAVGTSMVGPAHSASEPRISLYKYNLIRNPQVRAFFVSTSKLVIYRPTRPRSRWCGVDGLVRRPKVDTAPLELTDHLNKVHHRPAAAVEAPDHRSYWVRTVGVEQPSVARARPGGDEQGHHAVRQTPA
jgi:uncharacterized protein (TIGR02391 family)